MPGGLSLQQDEGVEEQMDGVLRGGGVGTLPGDREGPKNKDGRGVRGALWGYPSHAPRPCGPVAQLLRGRGEPEAREGGSRSRKRPARGPFAARAGARSVGAGEDWRRGRVAEGGVRNGEGPVVPAGDPARTGGRD